MNRAVSTSWRTASGRRAPRLRVLGALAALASAVTSAGAEPTPRPLPTRPPAPQREGAPSLPTLGTESTSVDLRGKILHSTRGRPGPVRLQVERQGAKPLEVLVAPNEICDQLGLSLRPGEEVHLRGALFEAKTPIFVASAVVVDGKAIAVRGKAASGATPGATKKPSEAPPSH
jgi:hypothetical protein